VPLPPLCFRLIPGLSLQLTRQRRAASGAAGVAALALLAALPVQAIPGMDTMVRNYCLKAVNDEVKASGKPAPDGMADYTCNCVVDEMKKSPNVEQAKATCKAAAAQKYNL
jgi:hypothetical protein